ncbi:hypothetical protein B0H63DRAFT_292304 [Podospora didyma]|uniref:Uncharacterized protein n=1 Tax=Podospora didyma TaxID=330526 RepID=A0AAE0KA52_9PEZI|nr:hypothetical protein B0H63DRAFT_292304 [Podospora didyma]
MAPNTYRKLQDKHVLVIGGSSGIGAGVAEAAVASGARVTISSSSQTKVDSVVNRLATDYPESSVCGLASDLSKPTVEADLDALFAAAKSAQGGVVVNHVVYTAGDILTLGGLDAVSVEAINKATHMRMTVPILLAKVAGRHLPKERFSSITITSGSVVDKPGKGWAVIGFLAGGLVSVVRALAVDLAPIRVNVVKPGFVATPLWNDLMSQEEIDAVVTDTEATKLLTGKFGTPEDVAEAYLWLLKDANVTGSVASTDGGQLLA